MAATEISDEDIVFECPSCKQSMAIDQRGAGMVIPCKGCGQEVEVPIPDRAEDLTVQEKLNASEFKISRLSGTLKDLQDQREKLDSLSSENDQRMDALRKQMEQFRERLDSATS